MQRKDELISFDRGQENPRFSLRIVCSRKGRKDDATEPRCNQCRNFLSNVFTFGYYCTDQTSWKQRTHIYNSLAFWHKWSCPVILNFPDLSWTRVMHARCPISYLLLFASFFVPLDYRVLATRFITLHVCVCYLFPSLFSIARVRSKRELWFSDTHTCGGSREFSNTSRSQWIWPQITPIARLIRIPRGRGRGRSGNRTIYSRKSKLRQVFLFYEENRRLECRL